jgi:biotin transport system substrate-specific component
MAYPRAPYVTYDSTLLDHVSVAAVSSTAWLSIRIASVLFLTALTAAAAQVSIHLPFTPVPLTLQPMVVLVGSAALGARFGMLSQVLYLLLGVAGFQVFAASPVLPQGALRLFGPTGGYLLAYPLAAFVTGYLAERGFDRRYYTSVLAMLAGLCVLFLGGVLWLAYFAMPKPLGLNAALLTGLYPFILPDLLKVSVAGGVLPAVWAWLGRGLRDR